MSGHKYATLNLTLSLTDVTYETECLPEDMDIRGNIMCSGDTVQDRADEDAVIRDLESGNEWAWCCVKVTARLGDYEGYDYLGGCSYASREDFEGPSGSDYHEDMKAAALDDLVTKLQNKGFVLHS